MYGRLDNFEPNSFEGTCLAPERALSALLFFDSVGVRVRIIIATANIVFSIRQDSTTVQKQVHTHERTLLLLKDYRFSGLPTGSA